MKVVLSLVYLAIKEQVRKKWIILGVLHLLLLIAFYLALYDLDHDSRLRGLKLWSIRLAYIYGLIISTFFLTTSINNDFAKKKVYLLLVKPVSRVSYYLGRISGFVTVLLIHLFVTSSLSVVFIYIISFKEGKYSELNSYSYISPDKINSVGGYIHTTQDLIKITGNTVSKIRFQFNEEDLKSIRIPPEIRLRLNLQAANEYVTISGKVKLTSNQGTEIVEIISNEWNTVTLPASWLTNSNSIDIECFDGGDVIIIDKSETVLLVKGGKSLIALEYLKCFILVTVTSLFLGLITQLVSTDSRPSFAVSFTLTVAFFCFLHGWMVYMTNEVDDMIERYSQEITKRGVLDEQMPIDPRLLKFSNETAKALLRLMPSFSAIDPSDKLLDKRSITLSDLLGGVKELYLHSIIVLIAGLVAISVKRQV